MAAVANAGIAYWQTMSAAASKPWLAMPNKRPVNHVIVIGGGIAGAFTAHVFAQHGIAVTLLEQDTIASGASGNHQGLLYAKISAADTPQNQLLQLAYPFVLQHLQAEFAKAEFWHSCGLLQQAFSPQEAQRQHKLLQRASADFDAWQGQNPDLQRLLPDATGVWWPQGAWVSPPLWIQALLQHPLIHVHEHSPVTALQAAQADIWHVHTAHGEVHSASHVIVCNGAAADTFAQTQHLQLRRIRGQVAYAASDACSSALSAAISAAHYLTPAFAGKHTFGASFVFGDDNTAFRISEHQHNLHGLAEILPDIAAGFATQAPQGRASVRADSIDHLPVVGPVGQAEAMRQLYAKLALDKNYRLQAACPYWEGLWLNCAHGTRGMLTAPLSAYHLAKQILEQKSVLPQTLQHCLHPNRLLIRQLIYANA
ncbi:FAD-dependent 5-carboxymethylaminomethyl-2-thiouridine(34) oxidoreductase MnmC [Vitreoscilla massiliensis]|uniref:FAD-dependent 5-carboxymethylaminomethyl-2-thiouridine(34) oxidoreductase MnmC n=1 Tax=Vitreoscilla massiliensis TaxID=1689272 RepID=A0ABY4E3E0_9NEIS|nr:FAD-dependent 5-carboxymethylaminomethyl-2-thiouridine(34) oxidoreductase MnmC [Vitreoscilla massiliensis]UOO88818.1 FAD-dependent 5-carboxymethylaminomethyl-2-thiouridine(34) oxidoreductase MnmC [Vitreoscilla massiliensis]